jgi:tetratricopeptide (TPR) repeat protein
MTKDIYGNSLSTSSRQAAEKFGEAQRQIRTYHGDPIATLDKAVELDPKFAMAWITRAIVLAQLTDRLYADEIQRSLTAAAASPMNDRERGHFAGAVAWAEGRFHEGTTVFGRVVQENPRDVLALQNGHVGCFFTGRQFDLRDWPLQAIRAHRHGDEAWHAVLGMAAFGLEECGDYVRAEAMGMEAIESEPNDAWAAHAVAHVHEMRGDVEEGKGWLEGTSEGWSTDCGFSYHNWWHLALLHVDMQDHKAALKLYDERIRPNNDANVILELIDASAMLWRLHLEGVDTGDRFARIARAWERTIGDGVYAFNDLHAIMAFLGAGRMNDAERTLDTLRRSAHGEGDNARMSREVGLPAAEAFIAFSAGRHAEAAEKLTSVRGLAQRFGGSHAQRDVLSLTALHAAMKAGMKSTAEALSSERVMMKPHSPWAARLSRQAKNIGAGQTSSQTAAAK